MGKNCVLYSRSWVHSLDNWRKEKRGEASKFSFSPMSIPKESPCETSAHLGLCREYSHGEKDVLRHHMITPYHAKYFAYELTKRCPSDSMEKLASALVDAQVDLNPHQMEAALFAFRSPLSRGALLADEVGLGKTIEAGLVLSQKWAERKRRILIITPANLRKQWHQEQPHHASHCVSRTIQVSILWPL